jgi:hypothetical protein
MKVEYSGSVKAMTDEELDAALEALREMLAARAGDAANAFRQGLEAAGVLELHLLGMRHPLAAKNLCSNLEAGSQLIS